MALPHCISKGFQDWLCFLDSLPNLIGGTRDIAQVFHDLLDGRSSHEKKHETQTEQFEHIISVYICGLYHALQSSQLPLLKRI